MDIKERLSQELKTLKHMNDKSELMAKVFGFLRWWNEQMLVEMCQGGFLSDKNVLLRKNEAIQHLTTAFERMVEDLKLATLLEHNRLLAAEIDGLSRDNAGLVKKVETAQKQVDRARADAEKAERGAINETRKNLQGTRDKLCGIAETSQTLRDLLTVSNPSDSVVNSIMNILANIELVSEEMEKLGLWPETSPKPRTEWPKEEARSPENLTIPFGETESKDASGEKGLATEQDEVEREGQEMAEDPEANDIPKGDDQAEAPSSSDKSSNDSEAND